MRRRAVIMGLGAAACAPLAARAQQTARVARIGYLGFGTAADFASRVEALRAGLRDLGYVEGKNIALDFRWAEGVDRLRELAAELVRENVDVVFATSSTEVEAAQQATKTIPIVFATHFDPIGIGHVASLARPGGNITGLSALLTELTGKALQMLKETVPHATKIGVLWIPTAPPPNCLAADRNCRRSIGGPAPIGIGANRRGIRRRVRDDGARTRRRRLRPGLVAHRSRPQCGLAARRSGIAAPLAEHVRDQGERAGWRPHELLTQRQRSHSAIRYLHRQNPERRQTGRSTCAATDQVRAGDQHARRPRRLV